MAAFTWRKKNIKNLGNSFLKVTKKMCNGTPNIKLNDKKKFKYTAAELEKEIFVYLIGNVHIFQKITTQKIQNDFLRNLL